MAKAKSGDTVKVHYTGKLTDGSVFDSSVDREPLEFEIGSGMIIAGFENGVVGLEPGESKTVNVAASEAYGDYNQGLVYEIDRNQLPEGMVPQVGDQLESVQSDGSRVRVVISSVSENSVTIDANHPLAGKDLVFDIELVEIL